MSSWFLSFVSNVSCRSACRAAQRRLRWETNRNQKPVVWGVPQGVIHFLLTFLFYVVFFPLSVSLWWPCAESDSRKMVLAPKLNLQHTHHRADCLLAAAGRFALEKQIQTQNTWLVLWTASIKAAFTNKNLQSSSCWQPQISFSFS